MSATEGDSPRLYTIGHSGYTFEQFLGLLKVNGIEVLADARSCASPKDGPHFDCRMLGSIIAPFGIKYVSLQELDQRPEGDEFYGADGELLLSRLAEAPVFLHGVASLESCAREARTALLRRSESPFRCSRQIKIVQRILASHGIAIHHVRADGSVETEELRKKVKGQPSTEADTAETASNQGAGRQIRVYSIGFTQRTAEAFFDVLKCQGIRCLLDIRLNNWSQFAGFTKHCDLPYFLKQICKAEYRHELLLAPSRELLNAYKKDKIGWPEYERRFFALMAERRVEDVLTPDIFAIPTVLLCYEPTAERCHRRLVLDYLQDKWGCLNIVHL